MSISEMLHCVQHDNAVIIVSSSDWRAPAHHVHLVQHDNVYRCLSARSQPQRVALYGTYTGSPCTRISPSLRSTLYVNCEFGGPFAPQHGPRSNRFPSSLLNSTTKSNCDADTTF